MGCSSQRRVLMIAADDQGVICSQVFPGLWLAERTLLQGVLMSQVNYAAMSDEELRRYFLRHREDKTALRAYLDRFGDRPRNVITTVDDPDFDTKIQAAILGRMRAADNNSEATGS